MLPGLSGTEVCRRMRALAPVPVIMVTALDAEMDIVLGLEMGAADYVTKPYRFRELVARIQAVLRRVQPPSYPCRSGRWSRPLPTTGDRGGRTGARRLRPARSPGRPPASSICRVASSISCRLLLSPPGQVRTRDELIDRLWSGRDLTDTRTLDTHIRRLRVKLERDPADPQFLVTVRGVGFRFDVDGSGAPVYDE
jgi:two-component system response regulator RegX3